MRISIFGTSSLGLLARLVVVHVFGTLFAYLVYQRFTQLGDGYDPADYAAYAAGKGGESLTSTLFTFFLPSTNS